jgi:hypothetical protein
MNRKEMKWREIGENCIMRSFITGTLISDLFVVTVPREQDDHNFVRFTVTRGANE